MATPGLEPDKIYTRKQVRELMGCSEQGGILPSTSTNSIMIYSDHESGPRFGYIDGWVAEDNGDAPVFEYTGAGNQGDQSFAGQVGSRNNALLQHTEKGRVLHLLTAVGKVANSDTKTHRYIGEMALDEARPYYVRQSPDLSGNMRKVIVFRMRAADGRPPKPADEIPPADVTSAVLVPADVTTSSIVPPERNKAKSSKRSGSAPTTAERREAALTDHYQDFLARQGHNVMRVQIKIKGTTSTLLTDLYDVTTHVLHEAKGTASREDIRQAIGQLMDYRRYIDPKNPTLVVLLPTRPQDDLQDLIASTGISLIYRLGDDYIGYPAHT